MHRNLPVELNGCTRYQRHFVVDASCVHRVAGGEVVAAIQHHVGLGHQRIELIGVCTQLQGRHLNLGVDGCHRSGGRSHLGHAHADLGVRDLALQIGQRHRVVVYHRDVAHASTGQVHQHR